MRGHWVLGILSKGDGVWGIPWEYTREAIGVWGRGTICKGALAGLRTGVWEWTGSG